MTWLRYTQGYEAFFVGSKLKLNDDSTFLYLTCGNIITGIWTKRNDSIFLKELTKRWRSDSLNKYGLNGKWPQVSNALDIWIIKDECLKNVIYNSKGKKGIQILKYSGK